MFKRIISHPQEFHDAKYELGNLKYPYVLMASAVKPTKGSDEYETWLRTNSFFHRGIVPAYSEASGLDEKEAKEDLQQRFALVREHEYSYDVESISGMSLQRLLQFCDKCQQFLAMNFGIIVDEQILINKTKRIKK